LFDVLGDEAVWLCGEGRGELEFHEDEEELAPAFSPPKAVLAGMVMEEDIVRRRQGKKAIE